MTETRIKFSSIVKNQLPTYVENEFPLIGEFLKEYYNSQEYKSGPLDIIQNIDQYIKVDEQTTLNHEVFLRLDIDEFDDVITIDLRNSPFGTDRFPDSYGLIKIDDEIILYTAKTDSTFTGCVRGFSGVTSYRSDSNQGDLVFKSTEASNHDKGASIENLTCTFLKEFLLKTKIQLLPGLSQRKLSSKLDVSTFIKHSKDFYSSKGTDQSYKILFNVLYGENVNIIRPRENLFTPSNAFNLVSSNFVVEEITGDPLELSNKTIFQDFKGSKAYTPIYNVEKTSNNDKYFKVTFDGGYNRDSRVVGSTYGDFKVSSKTNIIGDVAIGSTIIDVDSTIGFPNSGELYVTYPTGLTATTGIVSYTSRTSTQFLGCTNIIEPLLDGNNITDRNFLFTQASDDSDSITVRLGPILSQFSNQSDVYDLKSGDGISVKTLGVEEDTFEFNNWIYNNSVQYFISKIDYVSIQKYELTLEKNHYIRLGDTVLIIDRKSNNSIQSEVLDIITSKRIVVVLKSESVLDTDLVYYIKKPIKKVNSETFPYLSGFHANVQNVYKKQYSDSLLIASNSLPAYQSQSIVSNKNRVLFSGTFTGDTLELLDHGYYTGELIYYTPEKRFVETENDDGTKRTRIYIDSSLFDVRGGGEGEYFLHRVDNNHIRLAKSRSDLYFSKFIQLSGSKTVSNNSIEPAFVSLKNLEPQKIYREISPPLYSGKYTKTKPGTTGILVNGVEVLNYKSKDFIQYGKLDEIKVISPGIGFDVINPPLLKIQDDVGIGATGFLAINGNLSEIRIVNPGFDLVGTPIVSITGGNGQNAKALASTKLIKHSPEFSANIQVSLTNNTIGFSTFHKFRGGEEVVYKTNSQKGVGGLSTDFRYYASVVDGNTVKLHTDLGDSLAGINTVVLTTTGIGKHSLECVEKKSIVSAINIVDRGTGYENKKRSVTSAGISTSSDIITIKDHDYKSGEIIKYLGSTKNPIAGISTTNEYYVTVVDKDNFKLSNATSSTQEKNFFYKTKQYVDITSQGSGFHSFNYPSINVTVSGLIGISSIGNETFGVKVDPIFRGEVSSVHLQDGGSQYGASDIINFIKNPRITVESGKNAQVLPVITDGKISEVIVLNPGSGYVSSIDLTIFGSGIGCVLTPILENGRLIEVKVIESGAGYISGETEIVVSNTEAEYEFSGTVNRWMINSFEKLYQNNFLLKDDIILENSSSDKYGLQAYYMYAPRKLREMLYSVNEGGEVLYGKPDLKLVDSQETIFQDHSPIIGWAYDGSPIYGPYGYSSNSGGVVTIMKSGYKLNQNRLDGPPTSVYPLGFFVEDYTHYTYEDDSYLDENNGRFCVTPEYPNGTYAYFATIDENSVQSDNLSEFKNYRLPKFPYLIGDKYNSEPIEFNFKKSSNQEDYDIENNGWCRNTFPYNLRDEKVKYPYIHFPKTSDESAVVSSSSLGNIQKINIKTAGDFYKVGDTLNFDNRSTTGIGAAARVSLLKGKSVESIVTDTVKLTNAELIPSDIKNQYFIEKDTPHSFNNLDFINITGVSTISTNIEGSYQIGVSSETFKLVGIGTTNNIAVGSTSVTGLVTFFSVSGSLSATKIVPNDILGIGTERVKVLNIDTVNSRFRVLREIDGPVGLSHTVGSILSEDSRRFSINVGLNTTYEYRKNIEIYFNPAENVGLGTTVVGIGSVLTFSNYGLNSLGLNTTGSRNISVQLGSIYIKNHNFQTGDILTYSSNGGNGIVCNEQSTVGIATTLSDGQKLFVAKITNDLIGIATQKVGLGTTGEFVGLGNTAKILFFVGVGSGSNHSFKTNYENLTVESSRHNVTVTTDQDHLLHEGHNVFIDVNPQTTLNYKIKFNDLNRRVLVGIKTFSNVGVNTNNNTITIQNHNYESGDKVVYSSADPCEGLENNKIYYIVKIDADKFNLSNTLYGSTLSNPNIVGIASTSLTFGEIGLVNPIISAYRDSTLEFDISDTSLAYEKESTLYSAFKLNFYIDKNYTKLWESDLSSSVFNVTRENKSGLSTTSKVSVSIGKTTPSILYYRLDPVTNNNLPKIKSEVMVDDEIIGSGSIEVRDSVYSGLRKVSTAGTNFFNFSINEIPENNSYVSTSSSITYTTDCIHTNGPISTVEIVNPGRNYDSLPDIASINSNNGSRAELLCLSENIGKIENVSIKDIGYDYPSDKTLKPSAILPQIIKVDSSAIINTISVSSNAKGYTSAPKLVTFDGKTNKIVSDLDLKYSIKDNEVIILQNTRGMNNSTPTIIPVENNNGVGINNVEFDDSSKEVTIRLSSGFSSLNDFPFEVGGKVFVENVSVGINSTAKGFNSKNYGYKLFTLTSVTPNIGGIGTVSYNLSEDLNDGEIPGKADLIRSSGIITPEKYFPTFVIDLATKDFIPGEKIVSSTKTGTVQSWDSTTKTLRILSQDTFKVGEKIRGLTSDSLATNSEVKSYETYFNVDTKTDIFEGNQTISGYLNNNLQRVQDNHYYQNFSYSIKSRIPLAEWDDIVSSTNHSIGFKKFGDLQIESRNDEQPANIGLTTALTDMTIDYGISEYIDTNCVFDFDLGRENNINFDETTILSDEIVLKSKVLSDFSESVGNRVVSIDDVSPQFNNTPRATAFVALDSFNLSDFRSKKYFIYLKDTRFVKERQFEIVSLIHDSASNGYLNQYAKTDSVRDLGSFDFAISGSVGEFRFFPINSRVNDYDVCALSFNLDDNLLGIGTTSIGESIIQSNSVSVPSTPTNIVSIGNTYHSLKVLVTIAPDVENVSFGSTATFNSREFEYQELNICHDGTDVSLIEFGKLTTSIGEVSAAGFGTYNAYLDGSDLKVDFHPEVGIGTTSVVNTIVVGLSTASSGISTVDMKHARLESRITQISSSGSPTENVVGQYPSHISQEVDRYDSSYCLIQLHDTTNDRYEFLEHIVVDDHVEGVLINQTFDTEFANVRTHSGLGTFGSKIVTDGVGIAATTQILFTPEPNINVNVHVYMNALRVEDDTKDFINFNNGTYSTSFTKYTGTDRDVIRSFPIKHVFSPIFEKVFDGSDSTIVKTVGDTITIPDHFFVTGERVRYNSAGLSTTDKIGIAQTTFPEIGITTSFIPDSGLFIVKVDDETIQLSRSAEDALKAVPKVLEFTSVGIGASHKFIATNQNPKVLIALDNIIQSPIVSTGDTTILLQSVVTTDDLIKLSSVENLTGGDLLKIDSEIVKIEGLGIGATNTIRVRRSWLGTPLSGFSTGALVTKIIGNYNIVDNTLNFADAPFGNAITAGDAQSSFQGRVFTRSGVPQSSNEPYYKNVVIDDISKQFDGVKNNFTIKSQNANISGIANEGILALVNDIFQTVGNENNYELIESSGITTVSFVGTARDLTRDVGISTLPRGGMILSVGSTTGFGYQPLIGAGGTAVVSGLGTISSVSIGNSGSGYRVGVQTVNVSVGTSSLGSGNFVSIGTAVVNNNGNIVSIAITNPGVGYTQTNPPFVVIDDPLSYSGIALTYSSVSTGIGSGIGAVADIVVGQGSSVISFNLKNTGYGYQEGEILTVPTSGLSGVLTTSQFSGDEFQISIDKVHYDEFTGWSVGVLDNFDDISEYPDGKRLDFPLIKSGNLVSINKKKGSKIDLNQVLIVFINNILQVPGDSYRFPGGSRIIFSEPPRVGDDIKIIFYKGSGDDLDVIDREVVESLKIGDEVTLNYDPGQNQSILLQQNARTVNTTVSIDAVKTNPYFGPGLTDKQELERPITWCRQTEDKLINGQEITKDRELYESIISPVANIISPVGITTEIIYVDRLRPLFDSFIENPDINIRAGIQKKVTIIPTHVTVGASATAVVSAAGTISSIIVNNGGVGYSTTPGVSIASTIGVGIGTTNTALAVTTISVGGTVSQISVTNGGIGYTSSPSVIIGEPTYSTEENGVTNYIGDSGIVVGFGTQFIGAGTTQMIFDLHIPYNSKLRDTNIVGTAITLSGLSVGDYFTITDSNIGSASTSITSLSNDNSTIVGISREHLDGVYVANSVQYVSKSVAGVSTQVARIIVNTTSHPTGAGITVGVTTAPFIGNFSWGKVTLTGRSKNLAYPAQTMSGIGTDNNTGISTSTKLVRTRYIRFKNSSNYT